MAAGLKAALMRASLPPTRSAFAKPKLDLAGGRHPVVHTYPRTFTRKKCCFSLIFELPLPENMDAFTKSCQRIARSGNRLAPSRELESDPLRHPASTIPMPSDSQVISSFRPCSSQSSCLLSSVFMTFIPLYDTAS